MRSLAAMGRVAIVTDSTANLPPSTCAYWDLRVVPVQVIVGNEAYDEGVEISAGRVAEAMRQRMAVTTSRPAPARFAAVYDELAQQGCSAIVSAHLSADLSGTCDAARLAAAESAVPVTVVDSRTVSMGLGFACVAGARVAAHGADPGAVAAAIAATAASASVLFYVDSLEYLRRGGRIGSAERWIGQALAVKPILHVADGRVQPLEKVRTKSRALARMADLVAERADDAACNIAVMHLDAAARAEELAGKLRRRLPSDDVIIGEVGAVIASHVGPGMVAVVVAPVPPP
jgi:DegV family protein with EDD domain